MKTITPTQVRPEYLFYLLGNHQLFIYFWSLKSICHFMPILLLFKFCFFFFEEFKNDFIHHQKENAPSRCVGLSDMIIRRFNQLNSHLSTLLNKDQPGTTFGFFKLADLYRNQLNLPSHSVIHSFSFRSFGLFIFPDILLLVGFSIAFLRRWRLLSNSLCVL